MICDEAQLELSAYLDNEVPAQERSALEAHIKECAACQAMLAELNSVKSSLADLPKLRAPSALADAVRRAAKETVSETSASNVIVFPTAQRRSMWGPAVMGVAALLVAGLMIFVLLPLVSNKPSNEVSYRDEKSEKATKTPVPPPVAAPGTAGAPASDKEGRPTDEKRKALSESRENAARSDAPANTQPFKTPARSELLPKPAPEMRPFKAGADEMDSNAVNALGQDNEKLRQREVAEQLAPKKPVEDAERKRNELASTPSKSKAELPRAPQPTAKPEPAKPAQPLEAGVAAGKAERANDDARQAGRYKDAVQASDKLLDGKQANPKPSAAEALKAEKGQSLARGDAGKFDEKATAPAEAASVPPPPPAATAAPVANKGGALKKAEEKVASKADDAGTGLPQPDSHNRVGGGGQQGQEQLDRDRTATDDSVSKDAKADKTKVANAPAAPAVDMAKRVAPAKSPMQEESKSELSIDRAEAQKKNKSVEDLQKAAPEAEKLVAKEPEALDVPASKYSNAASGKVAAAQQKQTAKEGKDAAEAMNGKADPNAVNTPNAAGEAARRFAGVAGDAGDATPLAMSVQRVNANTMLCRTRNPVRLIRELKKLSDTAGASFGMGDVAALPVEQRNAAPAAAVAPAAKAPAPVDEAKETPAAETKNKAAQAAVPEPVVYKISVNAAERAALLDRIQKFADATPALKEEAKASDKKVADKDGETRGLRKKDASEDLKQLERNGGQAGAKEQAAQSGQSGEESVIYVEIVTIP